MDPTLEQGESVRSSPSEEEGTVEATRKKLTTAPISLPAVLLSVEEVEKLGSELSLGKSKGCGESVLGFSFYFSLSHSDLIGKQIN